MSTKVEKYAALHIEGDYRNALVPPEQRLTLILIDNYPETFSLTFSNTDFLELERNVKIKFLYDIFVDHTKYLMKRLKIQESIVKHIQIRYNDALEKLSFFIVPSDEEKSAINILKIIFSILSTFKIGIFIDESLIMPPPPQPPKTPDVNLPLQEESESILDDENIVDDFFEEDEFDTSNVEFINNNYIDLNTRRDFQAEPVSNTTSNTTTNSSGTSSIFPQSETSYSSLNNKLQRTQIKDIVNPTRFKGASLNYNITEGEIDTEIENLMQTLPSTSKSAQKRAREEGGGDNERKSQVKVRKLLMTSTTQKRKPTTNISDLSSFEDDAATGPNPRKHYRPESAASSVDFEPPSLKNRMIDNKIINKSITIENDIQKNLNKMEESLSSTKDF